MIYYPEANVDFYLKLNDLVAPVASRLLVISWVAVPRNHADRIKHSLVDASTSHSCLKACQFFDVKGKILHFCTPFSFFWGEYSRFPFSNP